MSKKKSCERAADKGVPGGCGDSCSVCGESVKDKGYYIVGEATICLECAVAKAKEQGFVLPRVKTELVGNE